MLPSTSHHQFIFSPSISETISFAFCILIITLIYFFFFLKTKYLLNFLDPFFFFVNPDLFPNYIMLWYNDPICTIIPPLYTQTPPIWAQILFDRKFFHGLVHYTLTHTSSPDTIYVVLYIDYIIAPNTLINPKWLIFSTPFPFAFYLSTN